jgi:MFS family permease
MIESRSSGLGRPFWTLLSSSGLSNLADGIFKLALPLVAIAYTRSPALVAGLELVRTLPWLLGALPVGALSDRLDRKRSMVAANATRGILVAIAAGFIMAGSGSIWLLYAIALGTGIAEVFYDTASQSILPSVVSRSNLDRANGRLLAVELGAQEFAGPPIAGLLVGVGLALSFATSAGLWILAIVALIVVRGNFRPQRTGSTTTIMADIREGLTFVYRRPVLRNLALMVGMSNLASSAVFAVFVLFAVGPESEMGLTEPGFGVLFAVMAAGGVLGGVITEYVQERLGRARSLTISVFGIIAYVSIPALTSDARLIGAVFLIGGTTIMIWNVITVSYRQRVTPDHLLGRVNSAYRLLAWGTRPLGAALGGLVGEWLGVRGVFVVMGVFTLGLLIPNRTITEDSLAAGAQ